MNRRQKVKEEKKVGFIYDGNGRMWDGWVERMMERGRDIDGIFDERMRKDLRRTYMMFKG